MDDSNVYDEIPTISEEALMEVYNFNIADFIEKYELLEGNDFDFLRLEFKILRAYLKASLDNLKKILNLIKPLAHLRFSKLYQHFQINDVNVITTKSSFSNENLNLHFISGVRTIQRPQYMICPNPDNDSIHDFLKMILEYNIHIIVMIVKSNETEKFKFEYWPKYLESHFYSSYSSSFRITLENEMEIDNIIMREIIVEDKNFVMRKIKQYQISINFEDFDITSNLNETLDTIRNLEVFKDQESILFHSSSENLNQCSMIICIETIIENIKTGEKEFNIFRTNLEICKCSNMMLQSENQYLFIYQYIFHFLKTKSTQSID